jgi:hypothetical protein
MTERILLVEDDTKLAGFIEAELSSIDRVCSEDFSPDSVKD